MKMIYFERLSALLGVVAVLLDTRARTVARPLSILATLLGIPVTLQARLYASMLLDLIYILLDLYGWYHWSYKGSQKTPLQVTSVRASTWWRLLIVGLTSSWLLGFLLASYLDAELPYLDALNTCFSLIAYWMLMRKQLEGWLLSALFDLYYAGIFYYENLYSFFAEQVLVSFLAIYGYSAWKKVYCPTT